MAAVFLPTLRYVIGWGTPSFTAALHDSYPQAVDLLVLHQLEDCVEDVSAGTTRDLRLRVMRGQGMLGNQDEVLDLLNLHVEPEMPLRGSKGLKGKMKGLRHHTSPSHEAAV